MKKIKDMKLGIEYEYDEKTKKVYKALTCYHKGDEKTIDIFEYEYIEGRFSAPYKNDENKKNEKKSQKFNF